MLFELVKRIRHMQKIFTGTPRLHIVHLVHNLKHNTFLDNMVDYTLTYSYK